MVYFNIIRPLTSVIRVPDLVSMTVKFYLSISLSDILISSDCVSFIHLDLTPYTLQFFLDLLCFFLFWGDAFHYCLSILRLLNVRGYCHTQNIMLVMNGFPSMCLLIFLFNIISTNVLVQIYSIYCNTFYECRFLF